jgi:hypothetical protein
MLVAFAVLATAFASWAGPASAHEGEQSDNAADLVRQAIAVMVNEPDNMAAIEDKLTDAAGAGDQSGTDATLLAEARDTLAAGDAHQARTLAEAAIGAQPHLATAEPPAIRETTPTSESPPGQIPTGGMPDSGGAMTMATGAEPGQATYADPLTLPPGITARGWTVLAVSIAVGLAGIYLSVRFRPRHGEA